MQVFLQQELDRQAKTLVERLRARAAEERRIAKSLEGCTFIGEPPRLVHLHKAAEYEETANILEMGRI